MRRQPHTHPCAECGRDVPCSGELERNYDGWPDVICAAVHLPFGITREVRCEDCHEKAAVPCR